MKKFTKLLGIVLIIALVMSMGTMALAADGDVKLSVSNPVDGHTYSYHQLFVGDLATVDGAKVLSNVKWGTDVADSIEYYKKADASATDFTVKATARPTAGDPVPQEVLDYLRSLDGKTTNDPAGQATADIISGWVKGTGTVIPAAGVDVATGYYVVTDKYANPDAATTTTLSTVICEVVGPTAITPKAGTTSHKKEVLDVNDTTETALNLNNLIGVENWVKSADHDFGDEVPFKLTTEIGSDFDKYDNYYLAVTDTLGAGLTLNQDSVKVYVDGELATKGTADGNYSLDVSGQTFKVEFTKLNGNAKAAAGKEVVVVYTATLGEGAVFGNPGNVNESYAEFSNNPNGNQEGKGKTPKDTVVVFTYKTDVDKVDPVGAALTGAGFTLLKQYKALPTTDTQTTDYTVEAVNSAAKGAWLKETVDNTTTYWKVVDVITGVTTFKFEGIDDGTYKLVESTTPSGYNTIDPITLVVRADHGKDSSSSTGYSISLLETGNNAFVADKDGGQVTFTKKDQRVKTLESGEIYGEIVNQSGTVLPSTGGIGTTIFYVVGSILVVAAGVLLITKKRMGRE